MVKIYSVSISIDAEEYYVAYYKDDTHIYLVSIEGDNLEARFIRIKKSQYQEEIIYDYEEAHYQYS